MDDHWKTLHEDPFARDRLKRSCELLNCGLHHSVLDIGCHRQEALEFLPKGIGYTGVDALLGDDFDGGLSLSYKFDRILCLEVLEHLKFPQKTLASIVEHLRDEGTIVISLPNEASIFHRIRSLLGLVDAECFSESGKHLHLPSYKQAYAFVSSHLSIQKVEYYVSRGCGSRCQLASSILKLIPESILRLLARVLPSLFSRGFIFVCTKR